MSPPDFASMDRKALQAFRNMAIYRKEAPTVENNYFTTNSKDAPHPQPADWVPTAIATEWCQHHGPAQHTPDKCHAIIGKPKPKPKIDHIVLARRQIEWAKEVRASPVLYFLAHITNKSHSSRRNTSC
jgi:hypothetical protein